MSLHCSIISLHSCSSFIDPRCLRIPPCVSTVSTTFSSFCHKMCHQFATTFFFCHICVQYVFHKFKHSTSMFHHFPASSHDCSDIILRPCRDVDMFHRTLRGHNGHTSLKWWGLESRIPPFETPWFYPKTAFPSPIVSPFSPNPWYFLEKPQSESS